MRGLHAKDRQRRLVPIQPLLAKWLTLRGDLPTRNLRRRFEAVRKATGLLDGWKQDWIRHTFASHHVALFGAEKTIAALGHGDYDMLFRHYRALVTREQTKQFFALTPTKLKSWLPPNEMRKYYEARNPVAILPRVTTAEQSPNAGAIES